MQIKRKLVGTQQEMIEYLCGARAAMEATDIELEGTRGDTRSKRAERRGYIDGLWFAINALTDWEPVPEKGTTDGSSES